MHKDAISVDEPYMHDYTMKYIMHKTFQTISITYLSGFILCYFKAVTVNNSIDLVFRFMKDSVPCFLR